MSASAPTSMSSFDVACGGRTRGWPSIPVFNPAAPSTALLHLLRVGRSRQTAAMRTRRPRPASIPRSVFAGFCFPPEVIVLAVRWYLRFGLSYRHLEELLAERGVQVDHVSVYRWVQRFTPLLAEAARPCRHRVGIAGRSTRPT
jgi:hypothetical protein